MISLNQQCYRCKDMKYKYVIWDWNGTLYDDVQIGVDAMNEMLKIKGYNKFLTVEKYREIFCFPVIEYYRQVGFDFSVHPFEELAELYIRLYSPLQKKAKLYSGADDVLREIKKRGAVQTVISACEKNRLAFQINQFDIMDFFYGVAGIDDNLARGKAQLAKKSSINEFTTSIVISPHKNFQKLTEIGEKIAKDYNLLYKAIDFKKKDGFLKTNKIAKELNLYRQNYCGCEFSKYL